ncbi:short chain amide porin [Desulfocapsa sulfexigens DSM 10523]|uniref:Short chain amide porin n=1 Tax=Desulfocapsa sulfexigens (strain DSM 10523 / SB164P1) TaxID=1167006 RepID=M1P7U5_DESSD|nr:selenite/tellurite reduction operon porin ExtI [Desulfocapsa sulfexigens]AGF77767.1 short chain amide porin [Desulfocapsa sulfexigens DSM 10523]
MRKTYSMAATGIGMLMMGVGAILASQPAVAGPIVEFGDDGYLQIDVKFQGIADFTDFGSGADGTESRSDFDLRRARLVFTGMINDTWGAKFQTCAGTSATRNFGAGGYQLAMSNEKLNSNIRLTDGYLIGLFADSMNMKLGLSKIPLTRANLDACFSPLTHERSSFVYSPYGTDATKNSRDMGLVLSGNFMDDHLKYFAAIMEGREGEVRFYNPFNNMEFITSPEPSNSFEYVGRLHYAILNPEGGPTAMGYKGTYLGKKGTLLTIGGGFAYEADAAYKNTTPAGDMGTPGFLTTKVLNNETVDYTAYTADIFYEQPFDNGGVITATALYLNSDFEDAYKTATSVADQNSIVGGGNGQKDGWYVKAGYVLPFTVGEKGLLQPFVRYEDWNLASYLGVQDQGVQQWGIGINYFVLGDQKVRFTMEYYNTEFDKSTKIGDYLQMTGANTEMYDSYDVVTAMFMVSF